MTYGEAMASGLPVVAGKHSGAASEVLKNCGILTDVKSPKQIFNSIIKYKDKKFYNKKRLLGLKRANKYFHLNIATKKYINHIKYIFNK